MCQSPSPGRKKCEPCSCVQSLEEMLLTLPVTVATSFLLYYPDIPLGYVLVRRRGEANWRAWGTPVCQALICIKKWRRRKREWQQKRVEGGGCCKREILFFNSNVKRRADVEVEAEESWVISDIKDKISSPPSHRFTTSSRIRPKIPSCSGFKIAAFSCTCALVASRDPVRRVQLVELPTSALPS